MRRRVGVLFLVVIGVLMLAFLARGFLTKPREFGEAGALRPKVITTFLPIYVFAVNVAGEEADVLNFLPSGVGPHEYSFAPADLKKIAGASLVFANGLGLENWLTEIVKKSDFQGKIIEVGRGLAPNDADPHVWLDPIRAEEMVKNIAAAYRAADPAESTSYDQNAAAYIGKLEALHQSYNESLAKLPDKRFIAFHSAFGYLAERYGLEQVAVIEEFPGKEPTSKYLADLVDLIKREKIKVLFSEPQFSAKIVETVARETGALVYELDTMEVGELAPDSYEKIMEKNLKTLVRAFSPR